MTVRIRTLSADRHELVCEQTGEPIATLLCAAQVAHDIAHAIRWRDEARPAPRRELLEALVRTGAV